MVGYLGKPALEHLHRSEVTKNVFDRQGQWSFEVCLARVRPEMVLGYWKGAGGVNVPDMSLGRAEVM